MARLDDMLRLMKDQEASDLHLVAGCVPRLRSHGELAAVDGWSELDDAGIRDLIREIASGSDWKDYEECGDLDFAYGLKGVARFRANYFMQEHGAGAVFRIIPEEILTLEQLKLPAAIKGLCHIQQGLVLITGPTGSGKSTTLAAIINHINQIYCKHIVTIEDPVEFVHQNQQSVLSHREVGSHTNGFSPALRAVIRQDADVVLVGELRDRETVALATTAAEMGMLVFGTLHTNSATKTVDRIVDSFPSEEQNQIRVSLSESLAGVVSQLLLRTADGKGRCAVHEILLKTSGLANVIREGNTPMLNSIIQSGKKVGMQSMDDSLFAAVQAGTIRAIDAHSKANDKSRFDSLLSKENSGAP
jgi:twitching motility protein PilT